MITIRQTQRKIFFSTNLFKQKALCILRSLNYEDFDLGIWLTTDRTLKKYNFLYRKKNKTTDILSFPYHTTLKPGKFIKILSEEDKNLGDIFISVPYVFENKHNLPGNFLIRMDRMLVHGIAHLLGYDHEKDSDYKKMITLENSLLKILNNHFKNE